MDAAGLHMFPGIIETGGGSPDAIGMFTTQISSDGINPINLTFDNLTSQFGINGLELQRVPPIPEPATVSLALLGLAGLGRRRRRA